MPEPAERGTSAPWLSTVATVLTSAAGVALFVYLVGGVLLASRYARAGLPVNESLSVSAREQLVSAGVRDLIFPFLLYAISLVAGVVIFRMTLRPEAIPKRAERVVDRAERSGKDARRVARRLRARTVTTGLLLILTACFLLVALVPLNFQGVGNAVVAAVLIAYTFRHLGPTPMNTPKPIARGAAIRVGAVAIVGLSIAVGLRESLEPIQLAHVHVVRLDGTSVSGYYVASTDGRVYVGRGRTLVAVPEQLVRTFDVSGPPRRDYGKTLYGLLFGHELISQYLPGLD